MNDDLLSRSDGAVHHLTLNRSARRNALTPSVARAIAQEIDRIEELGQARVIVLRGADGHFCAGLNLHWLHNLGATPSVSELQHGLSDFQSAVLAIVRCSLPVVGVLQGTVAGFGLDLAVACDLRIAGSSAAFTSAFARMGLVPDGGSTFTLPRLVSLGRALRLLMTSETLDTATALQIGLVEEVAEDAALDETLDRLLAGLCASDAASLRAIKRLTRAGEVGAVEQTLAAEGAVQLQALQSPAFRDRLEAFAERGARAGQR